MKNKNLALLLLLLFAVIQFPIILFLSNIKAAAFDLNFQEKEFDKYNPKIENRSIVVENLLFYLKERNADRLYIAQFTKEEKAHLVEVKILMHRFIDLLYVSMTLLAASLLILAVLDKRRALKRISLFAFFGSALTLLCCLIFYLIIMVDFDAAWTKFHHIFFRLGNWQFPSDYMLVQLYPGQFWIDIIKMIITNTLTIAIIVILVSILLFILYLYKEKKAEKFLKSKEGIVCRIKNI